MTVSGGILAAVLGVCMLTMVKFYSGLQRPLRTAAACSGMGIAAMVLLRQLGGAALEYNLYTAACSVILGAPGVALMQLFRVLPTA